MGRVLFSNWKHHKLVFLNYTVVSLMWQNQKMLLIARYNVKVSENLTGSFSQNLEENFLAEVIQLIWPLKCSRKKAWPLLDLICKTVFIINWNLVVVFSSSVNFLAGFQRQLQLLWGMYVPIVKPLYLKGLSPIVSLLAQWTGKHCLMW